MGNGVEEPWRAGRPRGRGVPANPANRFERIAIEAEEPGPDRVATRFLRDGTRSIIARNDSPDIPFGASVNPYRGCEHGCSYCYARPFHEYLGFSAGLDFETRILVKEDAPELLRRELTAPSWQPETLAFSGVTDCYQPVERRLELTRRCLAVCAELRNPVAVITKSALVARDADLLAELARFDAAVVSLSVTTLDVELARRLEPRAAAPRERLAAIARLAAAGIPVNVMLAPIIPGLTDHEIPAILAAAAAAGASSAGFLPLRLPGAVAGLFSAWLEEYYPERRDKVLHGVRAMRAGRLDDPRFGHRFRGEGPYVEQMRALFEAARRRDGLVGRGRPLSTAAFRRPGDQLGLFP
jgi:DNA repair photolyase